MWYESHLVPSIDLPFLVKPFKGVDFAAPSLLQQFLLDCKLHEGRDCVLSKFCISHGT